MGTILLDATRNDDFVKNNQDRIAEIHEGEESSTLNRKYREVFIPPEEEERLLAMYGTSVTQDFGDEFHMSRDEREAMAQRYEKFFKLKKGYTRRIRRLDKYVEAYRLVMDIINDLAKDNGLYDEAMFRKKVLNGDIVIPNLNFPKFQGKKKKLINWKQVSEFIADPTKDIHELTDMDERAKEMLTIPDEVVSEDEIINAMQPYTQPQEDLIDFRSAIGEIRGDISAPIDKKSQRWLGKVCPSTLRLGRKKDGGRSDNSYIWELDKSELEVLKSYDDKLLGSMKFPEFNGDFTNPKAVNAYIHKLEEYEEDTTYVDYNGRIITLGAANEMEYANALEACGWNIRNLYNNKDREKQKRASEKADKKRIEALRKMLASAQEESTLREQGYTEEEIKKLRKKRGKKNKKKKKKAKKGVEQIILDAVSSEEKDFKTYKKLMQKM